MSSKGEKTVIIHESNSDTKCATVTVTTNGDKLPPLIVFKGAPNGRIARNDLLHMDSRAFYLCQKNARTDEKVMLEWVDKVLSPYMATGPYGTRPHLF